MVGKCPYCLKKFEGNDNKVYEADATEDVCDLLCKDEDVFRCPHCEMEVLESEICWVTN